MRSTYFTSVYYVYPYLLCFTRFNNFGTFHYYEQLNFTCRKLLTVSTLRLFLSSVHCFLYNEKTCSTAWHWNSKNYWTNFFRSTKVLFLNKAAHFLSVGKLLNCSDAHLKNETNMFVSSDNDSFMAISGIKNYAVYRISSYTFNAF